MQSLKQLFIITSIFLLPEVFVGQIVTTVGGGYTGDGDSAFKIGINPSGNIALDASGNLYIPLAERHLIIRLSQQGQYTVVAGTGIFGSSGINGRAKTALLRSPYSVATDNHDNIYITDSYANYVHKVSPDGIISVFAGTGVQGFSGDNGPATAAQFNGVNVVATDKFGNVFVSDFSNNRVRKINVNGVITTIAGDGSYAGYGGDGMPAVSVGLGYVLGIKADTLGNIYISELSGRIRRIDANNIIHSVVDGGYGFSGDGGQAFWAALKGQEGNIAIDPAGNIYIPDAGNNRVRKIDRFGIINTIAGDGTYTNDGDEGLAVNARIAHPVSIVIDQAGNLYISCLSKIRKITTDGKIHTVAGNGTGGFNGDGINAFRTQFYYPFSVAAEKNGSVYISDFDNSRIRKIDTNGIVQTIAGGSTQGFGGDGGQSNLAMVSLPWGITLDRTNSLYIADFGNNRVRKIDPNGIISTVAGNGLETFAGDGGPAINASLNSPVSVALDSVGNIFIVDRDNYRIRRVDTSGIITTIAGTGTFGFSGDGGPAVNAQINAASVAVDKAGNILIGDGGNNRVRKIDKNGIINTVAGDGTDDSTGTGGLATTVGVRGYVVCVDSANNFYTSDSYGRILRIDTAGKITVFAGGGQSREEGVFSTDADMYSVAGISFNESGNFYYTESNNHLVRKITNYATTYEFNGNGNWDDPLNWNDNQVPPSVLPPGKLVIINPVTSGECIVNISQTISNGACIIIKPGAKVKLNGGLFIHH